MATPQKPMPNALATPLTMNNKKNISYFLGPGSVGDPLTADTQK